MKPAPRRPALLQLRGLHLERGHGAQRVAIVRDLDWTVRRGEHWVILGPNGSGKSSLLAALTAYLTPSGGEISLLGRTYGSADWRTLREQVGIVGAGLPRLIEPSTTAFDTVLGGYNASLNPWGRFPAAAHRRARRLLREVGLEATARRPWIHLSEGERQRTLLARARLPQPALLILDEPCAGLDPVARAAFLETLRQTAQRRRGPALVLVTHHVEEIVAGFTHALLLRQGRVVASGPCGTVLTSANLGRTFGVPVRLGGRPGSYRLRVTRSRA